MFFGMPNLSALSAASVERPQDFQPQVPEEALANKSEYTRWGLAAGTQHLFLSGFEGLSEIVRVSDESNPPRAMHALIVDYDFEISDSMVKKLRENPKAEVMPTYFIRTFSGHGRLIFEFEKPLLLAPSRGAFAKFAAALARHLNLNSWLPGLETKAVADWTKYYDVGREWIPVDLKARVPHALLCLWYYESTKNMALDSSSGPGTVKIPLTAIEAEVQKRWPGRWKGSFEPGSRGVRFWDPTADNETAAVVREDGMQCFTGNEGGFVPWRRILGAEFVEKYEADRIAKYLELCAYDGAMFWVQDPTTKKWADVSRTDFSQRLRCDGFDPCKGRGQTASELDRVELAVKTQRRVHRAFPLVFHKEGVVQYMGEDYLNISNVRCMDPAPPVTPEPMTWADGRVHFPFIYEWMMNLFVSHPGNPQQLETLLAWLKRAYMGAYEQKPRFGQCLFIAGLVGRGKTLWSRQVVGRMLGGCAELTEYLTENSQWTEELLKFGLGVMDDSQGASDPNTKRRMEAKLKRLVANGSVGYNQKYQKTGLVPYFGRVIVTCNTDQESLKILPALDMSTRDKLMLFNTGTTLTQFPEMYEIDRILSQECPLFCRFLIDHKPPQHVLGTESRFGVIPYHHPELLEETRKQGWEVTVHELLVKFMSECERLGRLSNRELPTKSGGDVTRPQPSWEGSALELYAEMDVVAPGVLRSLSPQGFATIVGLLARNGYNLQKVHSEDRVARWRIGKDLSFVDAAARAREAKKTTEGGPADAAE